MASVQHNLRAAYGVYLNKLHSAILIGGCTAWSSGISKQRHHYRCLSLGLPPHIGIFWDPAVSGSPGASCFLSPYATTELRRRRLVDATSGSEETYHALRGITTGVLPKERTCARLSCEWKGGIRCWVAKDQENR